MGLGGLADRVGALDRSDLSEFRSPTHQVGALVPLYAHDRAVRFDEDSRESLRFSGFVQNVRDHGDVLFIDLRDRGHLLQIVTAKDLTPESFETAKRVKPESSLSVNGYLRRRPAETENPADPLGYIELVGVELEVHSLCQGLPYPIHDDAAVHESVKLKYRFLQLRKRSGLAEDLKFRARFLSAFRLALSAQDFTEVETPLLFKSTPEGARDFVVPSRLHKGKYYALVQSPQLLKQLLMVGGLERYMQVTRCFRDEDPRADRQPEFTQLDLEASFLGPTSLRKIVGQAFAKAIAQSLPAEHLVDDFQTLCLGSGEITCMTHEQAMHRYGSDAPDLRFGLPLYDGSEVLLDTQLETFRKLLKKGALLKFIFLPAGLGELSRNFLDTLPGMAQSYGGQGLAWLRKQPDGTWQGPIAKFMTDGELQALQDIVSADPENGLQPDAFGPGAMLFFSCHALSKVVFSTMSELRQRLAKELSIPKRQWALRWVTEFPLFEWDGQSKRAVASHHPFTAPMGSSLQAIMDLGEGPVGPSDVAVLRSSGFDLVLNGREIGGGSARIHNADLQARMFKLLGFDERRIEMEFGFFVDALKMGAPPHCGMAFGVDRVVSLLLGRDSIRDVIAFPKTGQGQCLLSGAPDLLSTAQLAELGLAGPHAAGV